MTPILRENVLCMLIIQIIVVPFHNAMSKLTSSKKYTEKNDDYDGKE